MEGNTAGQRGRLSLHQLTADRPRDVRVERVAALANDQARALGETRGGEAAQARWSLPLPPPTTALPKVRERRKWRREPGRIIGQT